MSTFVAAMAFLKKSRAKNSNGLIAPYILRLTKKKWERNLLSRRRTKCTYCDALMNIRNQVAIAQFSDASAHADEVDFVGIAGRESKDAGGGDTGAK